MMHRRNSLAVCCRLNFLHREYLQHTWTSLPKGSIHLVGLYSTRHIKQVTQNYVIHADHRPNPKMFIVSSQKKVKLWLALLARKNQSQCPDYSGDEDVLFLQRLSSKQVSSAGEQPSSLQGQLGWAWLSLTISDSCWDKYRCRWI